MLRCILRAKIHMAKVTRCQLNYVGSLTVDEDLMDLADMAPYERILVSNVENGERFETYIIPGKRGSGEIFLNGSAARRGLVGDRLIIFAFAYVSEEEIKGFKPKIVVIGNDNKPAA